MEKPKQKDKPSECPKRLFSIQEAAYYLGLSPRTIYNGTAPRSKNPFPIKPVRIELNGKKKKLVRFDKKDLDAYCDLLKMESESKGILKI
jgi:predicted DNA-binding transcriptional regulator AlpA